MVKLNADTYSALSQTSAVCSLEVTIGLRTMHGEGRSLRMRSRCIHGLMQP